MLPITILLTLKYFFQICDKKKISSKNVNLILGALIFVSLINFGFSINNKLTNYYSKYLKVQETGEDVKKEKQNVEKIIKTKGTSDVVYYVKSLPLKEGNTILTTGTRLLNYYTNFPVYLLTATDFLYTEDFKTPLCETTILDTYNNLKSTYKVQYVVYRTTDIRLNKCFNELVNNYSNIIFDSGSYQVYELL